MRFSVIIPAHNAADRLGRCLASIREQQRPDYTQDPLRSVPFTDYELIVVADACEDGTAGIATAYDAIVEEVDFCRDGLTRNRGLDIAKGEWILFLDDDDWWLHPFVLDRISGNIEENPAVDVIAFSFIWKGRQYADPLGNRGNLWPAVWNKAWRRDFIGDTRFSDDKRHSDLDFSRRVFAKGPRVRFWDEPLYFYNYLRPGSITSQCFEEGEEFE